LWVENARYKKKLLRIEILIEDVIFGASMAKASTFRPMKLVIVLRDLQNEIFVFVF